MHSLLAVQRSVHSFLETTAPSRLPICMVPAASTVQYPSPIFSYDEGTIESTTFLASAQIPSFTPAYALNVGYWAQVVLHIQSTAIATSSLDLTIAIRVCALPLSVVPQAAGYVISPHVLYGSVAMHCSKVLSTDAATAHAPVSVVLAGQSWKS